MMRSQNFWRGLLVMMLAVIGPAAARPDPELKAVLRDLMDWLPGEYSSLPQVFYENAIGPPPDGLHEEFYRVFAKIDAPHLGENVIYTQIRVGSKDGPIFEGQQVVFIITLDEQRRGVNVSGRRIIDPEKHQDAHLHPEMWKTIAPDPDYGGNCQFLWRRHGKQLVARLADATHDDQCTMVSKRSGDQMTWDAEWILNQDELWIHDNGYLKDGSLFAGRADKSYLRMSKARQYECFASYRPRKGEPVVNNGFRMHDAGDSYSWVVKGVKEPVQIELMRGMWPSESGRNYNELLRLEMFQGETDLESRDRRRVLGNGWASADSDRTAFGNETWSARCKLYDPNAPPPK